MNHFVNSNGNQVVRTTGKVTEFSDVRENVNGTQYRVATMDIVMDGGEIRTASATIWETTFQKYSMKTNVTYNVDIEQTNSGEVYIKLTPFRPVSRITAEDFGHLFKSATPTVSNTAANAVVENKQEALGDFDDSEDSDLF